MTTQNNIIELLLDDHREVRQLLQRVDDTPPEKREDLFRDIVTELARHEAAEEAIVHAKTRDEVAGGDTIAQSVLKEESEAERLMADMEKMDPESPEFLAAFRQLRDDVLEHAEHEESQEFPRLRATLDEDELQSMGDAFERLKEVAPTRPHPKTPQTPEVRAAAGPIAGIFDRARDAARNVFSGR